MLERVSALASVMPVESASIKMAEDRGFSLLQIAKPSRSAIEKLGKLPVTAGRAVHSHGMVLMKVGQDQYWLTGPEADDWQARLQGQAAVVPLSHSRTRIRLEGEAARRVLARSAAIDFRPDVFQTGHFAMTGIHHTPVMIYCFGPDQFHIYAMRTFAQSVWEWLAVAAEGPA